MDVIYIAGTVLFFALMMLYARGCAGLGRANGEEEIES
jgi:hypothetical protein